MAAKVDASVASGVCPNGMRRDLLRLAGVALLAPGSLAGCLGGDDGSVPFNDAATIAEGRAAVQDEMTASGATAVSLAFVDSQQVLWAEAFGERESGVALGTTTLFPLASGSKMVATIAVLMLAERGRLALDRPMTTWLGTDWIDPALEPRYAAITPRMLMSHTSGLPGNDTRDMISGQPFTGYAAQVLAGLRYQRLKHAPGALAAYNNDGFTLLECLVGAASGMDYRSFVRSEVFEPLRMAGSRYQDSALTAGSCVRAYRQGVALVPFVNNVYASGGLYTTPAEVARLAMMLLNGGSLGGRRYLASETVAATGVDQTLGTFNPVPCEAYRYGLGWDTMAQPGLAAVGIPAWQKTGDAGPYVGTNTVLVPGEGLAVIVFGASNGFTSGNAVRICERILLRALVERGRLAAMPKPLSRVDLAVATVPVQDRADFAGYYASSSELFRLTFGTGGALTLEYQGSDGAFVPAYRDFKLRVDGWFAADGDPVAALQVFRAEGSTYVALRQDLGSGHYATLAMLCQRLERCAPLSAPWSGNLVREAWLPVNFNSTPSGTSFDTSVGNALTELADAPDGGLRDYLRGLSGSVLRDMAPPSATRLDGHFMRLPFAGKDISEVALESWRGQQWLRAGSYLMRPRSGVPSLQPAARVSIGPEGFGEWFVLPRAGKLSIQGASAWRLYGADFALIACGPGDATGVDAPAGALLLLCAPPGGAIAAGLA